MDAFIERLAEGWWVFLIRGIAAIIFGIAAFIWPGLTLAVLILLFAAYVLVDGILGLVYAIRNRAKLNHLWIWLLEAILGIVGGILRIIAAIELRKQISGEWFLVLGGALSVAFGILLVAMPGVGIISVVWLIGLYSGLFGMILIGVAMRLKRERPEAGHA